jgi:hypothetical protein
MFNKHLWLETGQNIRNRRQDVGAKPCYKWMILRIAFIGGTSYWLALSKSRLRSRSMLRWSLMHEEENPPVVSLRWVMPMFLALEFHWK